MGSWSVYCNISQIAITAGQECVLLPLKENKSDEYGGYAPATLPIMGKYDDYGGIEDVVHDENTDYLEEIFDCTIEEFCEFFTRGCIRTDEDGFPTKLLENKRLMSWKFMFIDRKVFDFMTSHIQEGFGGKGHFNMGNEKLLEYLGFEYIGLGTDQRYKHVWKYDGKEFESDGTWMHLKGGQGGIYDFESLCEVVNIPEDKMWLREKGWWQLWKLVDDDERGEMLCRGVGVSRSSFSSRRLFKNIARFKEKFVERFKDNPEIDIDELYPELDEEFPFGYFNNLDAFGDRLAGMVTLLKNLYPMSGSLKPHELYVTPQCGEYEEHQILLDKFAEINRGYVEERREEDE